MLFNSLDFAIFLPIVYILYWFVFNKNLKVQNVLIVVSSYIFYGWWDWRFLSFILFSTVLDYVIGIRLSNQADLKKRKLLLYLSLSINLGLLAYFKYFNFFIDSFATAFTFFGKDLSISTLKIILPVGISFYTFQTLSYTIDVYKRNLEPTKDFIAFASFVSFFPQLVAGPIERATHLLPQFYKKREFDYSKSVLGLRQILWGLFKKIVIADNCAEFANLIFDNSDNYPGSVLFLGAVFFAIQIYGDFSGYSDIAIGTSRLFGFDLMKNFAFPYFSRDVSEFWRRWHISLSTWFRDYIYFPLGGSKGSNLKKVRNTLIIFIVSGFWHGANWTFIIWGLLNALYFIPILILKKNRNNIEVVAKGSFIPDIKDLFKICFTFCLTALTWVFFRAESLSHAISYLKTIFSKSILTLPKGSDLIVSNIHPIPMFILIVIFFSLEWISRDQEFTLEFLGSKWKRPFRFLFYNLIIIAIFWYGGSEQQFIYFQF
jgi:alginate O-acetyltransferase complex protein AlgI